MLKLFFGVAGMLFIGLGLFGGNILEGFSGDNNEAPLQIQATTPGEIAVGETTTATITTASVSDTSAAPKATPQVVAASMAAEVNDQTMQQKPAEELVAVVNDGLDTTAATVVDISDSEGAEPMAPAQEAGDLITMAEQAKSSSRNEQVGMAKAVLTSNKPASGVVVDITEADKSVEVESAIKATVGSSGNDPLIVVKNKVNLRDGPSIDHPIVLTLKQGQELMEFKREGKWVHVGAYGTSGKIGWVHERLVGPVAR